MTPQDLNIILPMLVVIGSAILVLLLDVFIPKTRAGANAILAVLGLAVAMGFTLAQTGRVATAFYDMVIADIFSRYLSLLFIGAGMAGVLLAERYLHRMHIERGDYYPMLLFSVAGMLLMSIANDLIIVFLALELLSVPLYVLASLCPLGDLSGQRVFSFIRRRSEEAALKYFLLGTFSTGFVLFGIALVFGASGSTNLGRITLALDSILFDSVLFLAGAGLLVVGFGFKMAAVPFHSWSPDVYQGAPSPVTSFMSVGAKAAGVAALVRVFFVLFQDLAVDLTPVLYMLAALTMIVGNLAALSQTNIKRLLAYSSIAHGGYLLMAFVPFGKAGVSSDTIASMLFYLVVYALNSFGAWAVVIALEHLNGEDDQAHGLEIADYAGLAKKNLLLAIPMMIFMLSFTGMPLTLGFWGKFYLFRTAVHGGFTSLALIGLLASVVSAYYYLRVVVVMFMHPGEPKVERRQFWVTLVAVLAAVAVVALSFFPSPLFQMAGQALLGM